jgi:ElaB/YqjD/DUF883 family membrane-anchored ribosome-binding protein
VQDTAVEHMTTEEQISKNQDERDEARQNLRDTLSEVNAKVERAGEDLRPDHFVESHPIAACLVAGVLGALVGANVKSRGTGPVLIAALLGVAFSIRAPREGNGPDDRETSATD